MITSVSLDRVHSLAFASARRASIATAFLISEIPYPSSSLHNTYDSEFRFNPTALEFMNELGTDNAQAFQQHLNLYHTEYLAELYNLPTDALSFPSSETADADLNLSPRSPKRHRMSTD